VTWSSGFVAEYMDRIIPGMDSSLSKESKVLKKQGMKFLLPA
jgi:dihydrolipoamide dehydrogenase